MTYFYGSNPLDDDTIAPYKRTVGLELEFDSGAEVVDWFHENGHCGSDSLHDYQCRCDDAFVYPIHPTSDTTAGGGEYIIGGLNGVLYGSPNFYEATRIASEGFQEYHTGCSSRVGMHTHVGIDDLGDVKRRLLVRNYCAFQEDFQVFAAASFRKVRSNGCTSPRLNLTGLVNGWWEVESYRAADFEWSTTAWDEVWEKSPEELSFNLPSRPTFDVRRTTVEFRIWNSTRLQWRMILAAGLSSAFVEAASREKVAPPPDYNTHAAPMPLEDFLGDLLTPDIIGLMSRQRRIHAENNANETDSTAIAA